MKTRIALTFVACVAAGAAAAETRATAKDGFAKIQEAVTKKDAEVLDVVIPAKLVERSRELGPDGIKSWREGFGASLVTLKCTDARETGDDAVLRVTSSDGESMLPLHWGGSQWVLAAPLVYPTKGAIIDRANGTAPAKVHLGMRKTNDEYGDTAYSFRFATSDASKCKNRVDVWFCHNGDLHAAGDSKIADAGASSAVEWLPVGKALRDEAHAVAGHAYVVHCFDAREKDFYVVLDVTKAGDGGVDFTWRLFATGPGAPPNIHKSQPLDPSDLSGANGFDGLCERKAK
jgi:hypothetical protein